MFACFIIGVGLYLILAGARVRACACARLRVRVHESDWVCVTVRVVCALLRIHAVLWAFLQAPLPACTQALTRAKKNIRTLAGTVQERLTRAIRLCEQVAVTDY